MLQSSIVIIRVIFEILKSSGYKLQRLDGLYHYLFNYLEIVDTPTCNLKELDRHTILIRFIFLRIRHSPIVIHFVLSIRDFKLLKSPVSSELIKALKLRIIAQPPHYEMLRRFVLGLQIISMSSVLVVVSGSWTMHGRRCNNCWYL